MGYLGAQDLKEMLTAGCVSDCWGPIFLIPNLAKEGAEVGFYLPRMEQQSL